MAVATDICAKCETQGVEVAVGSASGRRHLRCPKCNNVWREKNAAAVALGALGGAARAASLSPAERERIALNAGNAFAANLRKKKNNQ